MIGPYLTEKALAFTLDVTVTHKPFVDDNAYISLRGPDGYEKGNWYEWSSIKTGVTSGMITLNLPNDWFPVGGIFQVCVSSKQVMALLSNCNSWTHNAGHEAVSASLA
jgi:hypothetical protein